MIKSKEQVKTINNRIFGITSVIAALLITVADYLLEFNIEYGVSSTIVEEAWSSMASWRFSSSIYLCSFMIPFYILGFYLLYKAIKKTNKNIALVLFILFSYGTIMGSPLIHGIMNLNAIIYKFGIENNLSHQLLKNLIENKITIVVLPVFLFHYLITWVIAPIILFIYIISGKSIFKRWQALLNPLIFMLVGFLGLKLFPNFFKYLTPGSINKANATLFFLLTIKMWNNE